DECHRRLTIPTLVRELIVTTRPSSVNELYALMLGLHVQADQQAKDDERSVKRRKIMLWAALAVRPIAVEEMGHALLVDDGGLDALTHGMHLLTEYDMRILCGPFINVESVPEASDWKAQRERPFGREI